MIEYTNSQITLAIDEYIHSKRDRDILKSRFVDGLTYDELSELYNLSVKQIGNIINKSETVLFKRLE